MYISERVRSNKLKISDKENKANDIELEENGEAEEDFMGPEALRSEIDAAIKDLKMARLQEQMLSQFGFLKFTKVWLEMRCTCCIKTSR